MPPSQPRADFDYDVLNNEKILLIYDLDQGNVSVTNDIQTVVQFIAHEEGLNLSDYKIAYKDSMDRFDAVIVDKNTGKCTFSPLRTTTREETITRLTKGDYPSQGLNLNP